MVNINGKATLPVRRTQTRGGGGRGEEAGTKSML